MMATTHAFVGAALASLTLFVAPAAAPAAMGAAFLGGLVPDFDLLLAHRRDLHFPVLGWVPAIGALVAAGLAHTVASIALAAFLVSFAVHPVMDIFGGSTEPEPWRQTTDRAVYNHFRGEWHSARRWIRYDGAPEDLGTASFGAAVVLTLVTGPFHDVALAALAISIAYTLVRKRLLELVALVRDALPSAIETHLPDRRR
jgi:hypothetical protein